MSARAAFDDLVEALQSVAGVRVVPDVGQSVQPPALVIPPPTITYGTYGGEPVEFTFKVALVVAVSDRAHEQLMDLEPVVRGALLERPNSALTGPAEPGSWGTPPLPCYLLTIEVSV